MQRNPHRVGWMEDLVLTVDEASEEPMLEEAHEDVIRRLRCVEGHTRGVTRMVESGADCLEVVRQINAVQGALDKVAQLTLQEHLMSCIPESFSKEDPDLREHLVAELVDLIALSRSS